jgi:hypothetical protein
MPQATYADLMVNGAPFIELRICLEKPPELLDLVAAFAAVGHQFDEFIATEHRHLRGFARLFVKEIRQGSTIVELVPQIAPLLATMDAVLIVDNFVTRYRALLSTFIGGTPPAQVSNTVVKSYLSVVRLLAKDPKGQLTITSAVYKEQGSDRHIEFHFNTKDAKAAVGLLEAKVIENQSSVFEPFENVLMVPWQSNRKQPKTGKATGEKAIIESVSKRPLAIKYESDLARERIKYETTEDETNVFKKGFFVDGMVERFKGKPVALRIINVRDVIPLPDDTDAG